MGFVPEKLLQVLLQTDHIQERPADIHIDKEIDVAVRALVTTRDGAEHSDIARPVTSRGIQDLPTLFRQ